MEYRTFVVSEFLIPLAILLDDLDTLPGKLGGNEVQVAPHEYGVAGAAFLILGAIVEGSIQGARLRVPSLSQRENNVVSYLPGLLAECDVNPTHELIEGIEEVITVRNAVAHCHIWEGEIDSTSMRWIDGPRLIVDQFGDKRHTRVTDGGLVTNRLRMNVLPTKIGRTDVSIAIDAVSRLWELLASCRDSSFFVTLYHHDHVKFRGQYVPVSDFAAVLRRDWRPEST